MTKRSTSRTRPAQPGFAGTWRTYVGPGYQFPVATERLLTGRGPVRR